MKSLSKIIPIPKFIKKLYVNKLIEAFLTPVKHPVPERELAFYKSAKHKKTIFSSKKKEIVVYEYGYSKKVVLLVHGWSGRGSQFYTLADKLLENRYMVVSFDAPAHGNAVGKQTSMDDFVKIIEYLSKQYNFDVAVGHSIGAMALLQSANNGVKFNKIISIAATNNIDEILTSFIKPSLIPLFKSQFYKKQHANLDEYLGENCAKNINSSTLIIHDSKDKAALVSSAFKIRQKLINGELLITNGLGHTRILKNAFIANRIIEFIKDV